VDIHYFRAAFWLPVIGPLIAGIVAARKRAELDLHNRSLSTWNLFCNHPFSSSLKLNGDSSVGCNSWSWRIHPFIAHIGPLLIGAIIGGVIASK